MINRVKQNLKNVIGWKTKRKIIVFSVDDYGNVRLASKEARENIDNAGYRARGHFDKYDTLETREDLEMLFEVLTSVKGGDGKNAVFTPFAVPCNLNFEKMESEGYTRFHYELLPETFEKLSVTDNKAYNDTWELWKEGIKNDLLMPQFHGREHLNIEFLEEKLKAKDEEMLTVLKNRSYTCLSNPILKHINQTAAYSFNKIEDNQKFKTIIEDGLNAFEKVFGYRSVYFTPPAESEHHIIYPYLKEFGIKYMDTALIKKEHQGSGKFKTKVNYTGKKGFGGLTYLVRNVVFEPSDPSRRDWVDLAYNQVEAAFKWNKPAIISSHRVNFCGHINPANRQKGLADLKELLKRIVKQWPEVEFMSADKVGDLIVRN